MAAEGVRVLTPRATLGVSFMRCPSMLPNEPERLRALEEYGLGPQAGLSSLEPVVRLAAEMFDMPMSAVNLVGEKQVFFAASYGLEACDMSRDASFCAHAILQPDVMVVQDASLDVRFHDNPLVAGEPGVRFYAGIPLRSPEGYPLGALCIIDRQPHPLFSQQDCDRLRDFAVMVNDKLELRRLEAAQQMWPGRFHDIASTSPGPLLGFDGEFQVNFSNSAAAVLLGYKRAEMTGWPVGRILPRLQLSHLRNFVLSAANGSWNGKPLETSALHRNGTTIPVELAPFAWKEHQEERFGVMLTDISERRRRDQEMFRLENFDRLTGLANRKVLRHEVANALEEGEPISVIAMDLDNFKDVNDTLGHKVGDQVLCVLADRMQRLLQPTEKLARMGGDEFAMMLRRGDVTEARRVANSLILDVSKPIELGGQILRMSASCGFAMSTEESQSAEHLLGNADLALYQSKSLGRGHASLYIPALRQEAVERRQSETELHCAVERGEFELYYQPQMDLRTGDLVGAEALLRWNHPQKGCVAPAQFLPRLEAGSLAATVGKWVLHQALLQASLWRKAAGSRFRMGVNLFGVQFLGGDLADDVRETIQRYGLPPECVELEITENIILNNDQHILETLRQLRDEGICIAFDDFGTGYASLSMLRDYPLTRIKVDRLFTMNMCSSHRDEATVAATVGLARNYDLQVIAEGVESKEQLTKLKAMGCDEGQGYLFGKPMTAGEFQRTFLRQMDA